MPKNLQKKIKAAIIRPPRFHKGSFEKRATINGIGIYGCSSELEECEKAFLENLTSKLPELYGSDDCVQLIQTNGPQPKRKYASFSEFAEMWFEEVYRPRVAQQTHYNEKLKYKNHIAPAFGAMKLGEITPLDCVRFFNHLADLDYGRTAESCYGILNRIFEFAISSSLIKSNPMEAVDPIEHERENGVPLTIDEEKEFLSKIAGTKYEAVFLMSLYVGLRPCELASAKLDVNGEFIISLNKKRKKRKKKKSKQAPEPEYKEIPITPMLRRHLDKVMAAIPNWEKLAKNTNWLSKLFKRACPNHKLYDLRTTFATRSQECGVSETVVQIWMGHSPRTLLGKVYTDFSDEYLLVEGSKVDY